MTDLRRRMLFPPLALLLLAGCGDEPRAEPSEDAAIGSDDASARSSRDSGPTDAGSRGTGETRLVSVRVPGERSDVIEATFSGRLRNVSNDDFFTNRTHALVKAPKMTGTLTPEDAIAEVAHEDGTYTYVLPLSDHIVPGETPQLVYFRERSDITDRSGRPLPSLLFEPVDVSEVTSYDGPRALVTISRAGTWRDVVDAMDDDIIIRIERGFDSQGGQTYIDHDNLTLTAFGTGDPPRITFAGSGFFSIAAIDRNHLTFVGLHLVSDGLNGIAFRDRSSFSTVIDCTLERVDTMSNAQAAIDFFFQTNDAEGYTRLEGPKALFNTIQGHNGGIFFNLSEVARFEWRQRYVEDVNGDGYRQPAMIIGNYIRLRNHGSDKGDAIAVSRADHNWAEVSFNRIDGWVDDGFDAFQAQRVIVEFNTWDQQLEEIRPKGGNGIKTGGTGRPDDEPQGAYTTGFSGDIIVRYNIVRNTFTSGGNNQFGINTNGGGGANGMSNTIQGEPVTYGKTLVYGNVIYGTRQTAMQIWRADGGDFEIYNNLFISEEGMGVRFTSSANPQGLVFRNNIVSRALAADGIVGQHNIWLEEYRDRHTYTLGATESFHALRDIYADPTAIEASAILPTSPTVDAGDASGLVYGQDSRGNRIVGGLDIGPVESVAGL